MRMSRVVAKRIIGRSKWREREKVDDYREEEVDGW